jgi:hypothetical protein
MLSVTAASAGTGTVIVAPRVMASYTVVTSSVSSARVSTAMASASVHRSQTAPPRPG